MYAAQQLHRLQALPDNQRRAELAKLRRGIGHAPGELPELWGSFLLGMPESFQGRSAPSAAEWAATSPRRRSTSRSDCSPTAATSCWRSIRPTCPETRSACVTTPTRWRTAIFVSNSLNFCIFNS